MMTMMTTMITIRHALTITADVLNGLAEILPSAKR
jgi:hypothetical protein